MRATEGSTTRHALEPEHRQSYLSAGWTQIRITRRTPNQGDCLKITTSVLGAIEKNNARQGIRVTRASYELVKVRIRHIASPERFR